LVITGGGTEAGARAGVETGPGVEFHNKKREEDEMIMANRELKGECLTVSGCSLAEETAPFFLFDCRVWAVPTNPGAKLGKLR